MTSLSIACPKCRIALRPEEYNFSEFSPCAECSTELQLDTFMAFTRPPAPVKTGDALAAEGLAGCFFHPGKTAVVPCASCGRFLCSLCDLEWDGGHYCPHCIELGRDKGSYAALDNQRFLYDELAMTLALFGIFTCGITCLPALFCVIKGWNTKGSLVRQSKSKFVLAAILSVLLITLYAAILITSTAS